MGIQSFEPGTVLCKLWRSIILPKYGILSSLVFCLVQGKTAFPSCSWLHDCALVWIAATVQAESWQLDEMLRHGCRHLSLHCFTSVLILLQYTSAVACSDRLRQPCRLASGKRPRSRRATGMFVAILSTCLAADCSRVWVGIIKASLSHKFSQLRVF